MQPDEPVGTKEIARLTDETTRVKLELERLTGLSSRWSGRVYVVETDAYLGQKEWTCAITLNRVIIRSDDRYAIQLHELIHSVSTGCNEQDFRIWPGLEEGVAELLEHALLPDIADSLGLTGLETELAYPGYTATLRSLFALAHVTVRDGCLTLLRVPLAEREWLVVRMVSQANPDKGAAWAHRCTEPHLMALRPRQI
jgi:hypothetical protein